MASINSNPKHILVQLKRENGQNISSVLDLPQDVTTVDLKSLCQKLDGNYSPNNEYKFSINNVEIVGELSETLKTIEHSTEKIIDIVCNVIRIFRVRSVTRCSSTLGGHAQAIVSVAFSPDALNLATGSGDATVRLWDLNTETPKYILKGHNHWVLSLAWSPDGKKLASGCRNGYICIWDPKTGKQHGKTLIGHKGWINGMAWKPSHLDPECNLLASCSKDNTIIVWNILTCERVKTLSSHTQSVTCIKWSGSNHIFSSSQDRTIKMWDPSNPLPIKSLMGHAHWVNHLALSTDYVIRTGPFDYLTSTSYNDYHIKQLSNDIIKRKSHENFQKVCDGQEERLVSCSDDFTLFLWRPHSSSKPIARMTGHQGPINHVTFSPNTSVIASASFDKSIKIWNGFTGKFIASLRGHIHNVYQISWSADNQLLASCSADSTIKIWDMKNYRLLHNLAGHADEIYAIDWSPGSEHVASGGKDAQLKIWRS